MELHRLPLESSFSPLHDDIMELVMLNRVLVYFNRCSIKFKSDPNKFILVSIDKDMIPVIHVLSVLVFSKLILHSLDEASFWDDRYADQFDAMCSAWSER